MDKKRCKRIIYEMQYALNSIKEELDRTLPYAPYLLEKLQTLETDIPCLKEEFSNKDKKRFDLFKIAPMRKIGEKR